MSAIRSKCKFWIYVFKMNDNLGKEEVLFLMQKGWVLDWHLSQFRVNIFKTNNSLIFSRIVSISINFFYYVKIFLLICLKSSQSIKIKLLNYYTC